MNNDLSFEQKIEKILQLLSSEELNLLPLISKENSKNGVKNTSASFELPKGDSANDSTSPINP